MRQQQLMMPDIQTRRSRGQKLEKEQAELLDYYLETLPDLEGSDLTEVAFNATNELQFMVTYQAVYYRVKKMGWERANPTPPEIDITYLKSGLREAMNLIECLGQTIAKMEKELSK